MHFFPPPNRLLAQLEIDYADGRQETIVTDKSWKGAVAPVVHSEIYSGETYDARLEQKGWENPRFDDSRWTRSEERRVGKEWMSGWWTQNERSEKRNVNDRTRRE